MSQSIQLELISGGHAELLLDDPDEFPSSYFISMQHSGNAKFWKLVISILVEAKRSVCKIGAALGELGLTRRDLTTSAMRKLLQTQGYAFGVFRDFEPAFCDLDAEGRKTFLFIRNPRDVVAQACQKSAAGGVSYGTSLADFLRSPEFETLVFCYRSLADFARKAANVTIFRYEDCLYTWRGLAVDLVREMDLPLSRSSAMTIADSLPGLANTFPAEPYYDATQAAILDDASLAYVEEQFADSMAFFGYVPERPAGAAFTERQPEFLRAVSARLRFFNAQSWEMASQVRELEGKKARPSVRQIQPPSDAQTERAAELMNAHIEGDSVLLWRLRSNSGSDVTLLGRRVRMEVDSSGCRLVVGQPQTGEKTVAVYGCSLTFGWGINADETFCSLLQADFPKWRIENHGVGGYSGLQNLIQLQRDSRWSVPDYVTFCWISNHLIRNVGDPAWLQIMMKRRPAFYRARRVADGKNTFPCAALDADGQLQFRFIKFPRWDFVGVDLNDLRYDPHYLDLVCFAVFQRASEIVRQNGGNFFVTTLSDHLSPQLRRMLDDAGVPVVDASVKGKQFTLLPDDGHPNAAANKIYAERIREYLMRR